MRQGTTFRYDSREAVLKLLADNARRVRSASFYNDDSFYGCSYTDALRMFEHGWFDGVEQIVDNVRRVTAHVTQLTEQEDYRFDPVEGIGIDIGRYTSGQPDCWLAVEPMVVSTRGNRVLRVLFNPGASACTTVADKLTYGTMVAGAVAGLEQQGYRIELWSSYQFEDPGSGREYNILIQLKRADAELSLSHLAFDAVHAGFQRRINFAVSDVTGPHDIRSHSSDTAYPWVVEQFEHDIYIPAVRRFVDKYRYQWNEQAAEECAVELLRRYQ